MTPRVSLGGIVTTCQRPGCRSGSGTFHRHHRRGEHMFVTHFAARRGTPRYDAFCARYNEFRPEDVVLLCDECHFEIHLLYGPVIRHSLAKLDKPVSQWSWPQARVLMRNLNDLCLAWLRRPEDYTVQSARIATDLLEAGSRRIPSLPRTQDHYASLCRLSRASQQDL